MTNCGEIHSCTNFATLYLKLFFPKIWWLSCDNWASPLTLYFLGCVHFFSLVVWGAPGKSRSLPRNHVSSCTLTLTKKKRNRMCGCVSLNSVLKLCRKQQTHIYIKILDVDELYTEFLCALHAPHPVCIQRSVMRVTSERISNQSILA